MAHKYDDPFERDQEVRQSGFWGARRVRPSDASGSLSDRPDAAERYRHENRQMRSSDDDYEQGRYQDTPRPYSGRSLSSSELERYYGRSDPYANRHYEWDSRNQDWERERSPEADYGDRYGQRRLGTDRNYDWRSARQSGYGRESQSAARQREDYPSYGETSWRGHGSTESRYRSSEWDNSSGEAQGTGISHRGKGPKGYVRSDERLQEIVCERLLDDEDIDASDVSVRVSGGVVTLEGTVDSRQTKFDIEECAEMCGAKEVVNNLRIKRAGSAESETSMTASAGSEGKSNTTKSSGKSH